MKKTKLLLIIAVVSFMISCGDDGPLKDCVVCKEKTTGVSEPEYCANKVTVAAYITTMESTNYTCTKK